MMKINVYYGGRGLIEDSSIYIINKITEVLEELRVEVKRYNLYEEKNNISVLPNTLKEADGIILAVSVEWFGIGGFMQQFLDSCWLYGDKEKIKKLYMLPIVTSVVYGEKDAGLMLTKAWELLGGVALNGLFAYIEDYVEFETNPDYAFMIEKAAESLYRSINQKAKVFPNSLNSVSQNVISGHGIDLTPQESEQLSKYVSDDTYVKKQKEDIQELAQMFKEILGDKPEMGEDELIRAIKKSFSPIDGFEATYGIQLTDKNKMLVVEINKQDLNCYYGEKDDVEVFAKADSNVMKKIITGNISFQKAFMSGELTAKGNFKTLRMFDTLFKFS